MSCSMIYKCLNYKGLGCFYLFIYKWLSEDNRGYRLFTDCTGELLLTLAKIVVVSNCLFFSHYITSLVVGFVSAGSVLVVNFWDIFLYVSYKKDT